MQIVSDEGQQFVLLGDTFAVFDRLGGRAADHAVSLASNAFRDSIRAIPGDPKRALVEANRAIIDAVEADATLQGIGCTAAALVISASAATVAWAGDVHVFRLCGTRLDALTREHSLERESRARGSVDSCPPNVIVRALGMPAVEVEVIVEPVARGDLFVLASDGVRNALGDANLSRLVSAYRDAIEDGARAILKQARVTGPTDDLTVVIARAHHDQPPDAAAARA